MSLFSHVYLIFIAFQINAMERRGIEPYSDTLAALSEGHSNSLQLDLAEEFLERISEIKPKHIGSFNALLSGCAIMVMHWIWKYIL
jgi:hypothetical protein